MIAYTKLDEFVILSEKVEEELVFGRIFDIIVTDTITFYIQLFNTEEFSGHYNCYIVTETHQYQSLLLSTLLSYLCLHPNYSIAYPQSLAITVKHFVK